MSRDKFKTLGIGLIALAVLFAGLVLAEMWIPTFPEDVLIRALISLIVTGVYGIYLGMVWDDMEKSRHRAMLMSLGGFGGVGVVLILLQTWGEVFAWDLFAKMMVSLIVVSGAVSFILGIREDFFNNKRLKDQDYID